MTSRNLVRENRAEFEIKKDWERETQIEREIKSTKEKKEARQRKRERKCVRGRKREGEGGREIKKRNIENGRQRQRKVRKKEKWTDCQKYVFEYQNDTQVSYLCSERN